MPLFGTRGAASVTGFGGLAKLGYLLRNSLRFRASNSNYLSRTFGTPTNNKVWTWSAWVKRGSLSLEQANHLFFASPTNVDGNPSTYSRLVFETDGTLRLQSNASAGELFISSGLFRDPAAWYHIVLYMDAVNTTVRCYINGTEIAYESRSNPTNSNTAINGSGNHHRMGFFRNEEPRPMDGYMAEVNFIDGQALTPSSFGKTDGATGQWIPKKFGGAYGTNGFYLPFTNTTSTSTLGNDFSGNSNTWTVNNFSLTTGATYDSMTDVPTLSPLASNYATLNPLSGVGGTFSNGNLQFVGATDWRSTNGTIAFPTSGQWYFEATLLNAPFSPRGSTSSYNWIGVGLATNFNVRTSPNSGNVNGWLFGDNGYLNNFASTSTDSTVSLSSGDVIRIGVDTTNNTYTLYKNAGLVASSTFNVTAGTQLVPYNISYSDEYGRMAVNFGQRPFAYPTTSGAFSGYKSLNAYNLP